MAYLVKTFKIPICFNHLTVKADSLKMSNYYGDCKTVATSLLQLDNIYQNQLVTGCLQDPSDVSRRNPIILRS